ncbi:hypothetical protein D9611_011572 [Ephemerocybe angulata]|uniref:F-box domain-containing protein n=1 Tax=Ephemerocybe angulata TaxID=980116 RepID=A0A8H5AV76_9AGAR|nr:hypothetical protein D9611_011572 [Tulosesus angulatus]
MSSDPVSVLDRVPTEVLQKVFHTFVSLDTKGIRGGIDDLKRRQRPVLLSHTCREWRNLALGDPFLWADVQIHGVSELYFSFLARSHPVPFDLTIRSPPTIGRRTNTSEILVDFLRQKMLTVSEADLDRIKSLHIRLNGASGDETVSRLLRTVVQGRTLPLLQLLHIHADEDILDAQHDIHPPFLNLPPSLATIHLINFCSSCIPGQEALTTLELRNRVPGLSIKTFQRILRSFPFLESLVIGESLQLQAVTEEGTQDIFEPVHTPHLKRLALASKSITPSTTHWIQEQTHLESCRLGCPCIFRSFVAENLEYLEIFNIEKPDLTHVLPFINTLANHAPPERPRLRLFLNGTMAHPESYSMIRRLPRKIHLHLLLQGFWGSADGYTFLDEFLEANIYLPQGLLYGAVTAAFEASGGYLRHPTLAPGVVRLENEAAASKYGLNGITSIPIEPLLNRQYWGEIDYEAVEYRDRSSQWKEPIVPIPFVPVYYDSDSSDEADYPNYWTRGSTAAHQSYFGQYHDTYGPEGSDSDVEADVDDYQDYDDHDALSHSDGEEYPGDIHEEGAAVGTGYLEIVEGDEDEGEADYDVHYEESGIAEELLERAYEDDHESESGDIQNEPEYGGDPEEYGDDGGHSGHEEVEVVDEEEHLTVEADYSVFEDPGIAEDVLQSIFDEGIPEDEVVYVEEEIAEDMDPVFDDYAGDSDYGGGDYDDGGYGSDGAGDYDYDDGGYDDYGGGYSDYD